MPYGVRMVLRRRTDGDTCSWLRVFGGVGWRRSRPEVETPAPGSPAKVNSVGVRWFLSSVRSVLIGNGRNVAFLEGVGSNLSPRETPKAWYAVVGFNIKCHGKRAGAGAGVESSKSRLFRIGISLPWPRRNTSRPLDGDGSISGNSPPLPDHGLYR